MFRKTTTERQMSLFSGAEDFMSKRASKKYLDPKAWHNQFFMMITSKIYEEIFRVLFPEGKKQGHTSASIRILVAMSILKASMSPLHVDEPPENSNLLRRAHLQPILTLFDLIRYLGRKIKAVVLKIVSNLEFSPISNDHQRTVFALSEDLIFENKTSYSGLIYNFDTD